MTALPFRRPASPGLSMPPSHIATQYRRASLSSNPAIPAHRVAKKRALEDILQLLLANGYQVD